MAASLLTASEQALSTLRDAVALSPADETAITWVETRQALAGTRSGSGRAPQQTHAIQVRVIEAGRLGVYRPANADPAELAAAIRQAMAQARAAEPLPAGLHLTPEDASPVEDAPALFDDAVAALTPERAQQTLRDHAHEGEHARLAWSEAALTVVTSRGFSRHLRATGISLDVRCGRHAGAGFAAVAARSLEALDAPAVFGRARRRDARGEPAEWTTPASIVLSPEATATLAAAFGAHGLAAAAWHAEMGFCRRHHGASALASVLTLIEDGSRAHGLPFPLDLTGARRRAATLVADGVLQGPVADPLEAARLGVLATRPTLTGDEGGPEHLFVMPGGVADDDLLAAAGDGIYVAHLDTLDCWADAALTAQTTARGLHRIERGALTAPLPDAVWTTTLPQALAAIKALGTEIVVVPNPPPSLGGTGAPASLLAAVGDWHPL
jgi:predicted Zn-dependent protease